MKFFPDILVDFEIFENHELFFKTLELSVKPTSVNIVMAVELQVLELCDAAAIRSEPSWYDISVIPKLG